jgi:uncharacterized protein (DUF4415 family)
MSAKSTKKTLKTKTDWSRLHREQDEDAPIAYDEDAPETSATFWANAEVVMPSHKTHVSMRLDDDIIDYFKQEGRGYQSKINAVLKAYVRTHPKQQGHHA